MNVGKILVGIDGSANSGLALRWAVDEAAGTTVEVVAVHSFYIPALAYGAPGFIPPEQLDADTQAKAIFDAALEGIPASRTAGVTLRVVEGYPADVLARAGEGPDVATVVIGARGHGKVEELFLGSVSHSLTHHCHKPLVIVPARWAGGDGRVVVGFDGTPESHQALRWAVDHARRRGRTVQAVTVVEAGERPAVFPDMGTSGVNITTEVVEGHPAEVLLDRATGADLLVVGTRGRGRLREALTGSVAHACAEHSPVPVAIVRNPVPAP